MTFRAAGMSGADCAGRLESRAFLVTDSEQLVRVGVQEA